MELSNAKRVLLQTTLTPIDFRERQDRKTLSDPGRPAAERAARLRAFMAEADEIEAIRSTTDPAQRALLAALETRNPGALIAAVHQHDRPAGTVVDAILASLAGARKARVTKAGARVRTWIEEAENRVCLGVLNAGMRPVEKAATADEQNLSQLAGARAGAASAQAPEERPKPPEQEDRPGTSSESLTTLREHLRQMIKVRLHGACDWGSRLNAVLNAGQCPDNALLNALSALDVAAPEQLDEALTFWAAYKGGEGDGPNALAPKPSHLNALMGPLGYLHLERISFVPAGVQHGELVYSLPLSPGEKVFIVHKVWSKTEEELLKFSSDSFEDYSERGVAYTTNAAESTTAQHQHASSFGASVSVSGGYGWISGTMSSSYSTQQSESDSRQVSINHSNTITKKASARSRKEHKISFRLATKSGVEDETTRVIINPDPFNCVRYDFYQLLRRWRVNLHRYGVRLTYDLTLPEPAADLLKPYIELEALETLIEKGFVFEVAPNEINRANWQYYANKYGAVISPPPPLLFSVQSTKASGPWGADEWKLAHMDEVHVSAPEGYTFVGHDLRVMNTAIKDDDVLFNVSDLKYLHPDPGITTDIGYALFCYNVTGVFSSVRAWFVLHEDHERAWQTKAYQAVREAAEKAYLERRQMLESRMARILGELGEPDALTLRRREREELMKAFVRWLFGPGFQFSPKGVSAYYDESGAVLDPKTWKSVLEHEKFVSFLHHAFEWENMSSFLYPYFWTDRHAWHRRIALNHKDPFHEAFLRAGAVRVVLPIRPGWEKAVLSVLETGTPDGLDGTDSPYLTIAEEIENFAKTNYPGIIPANPDEIDPEKATQQSEGRLIGSWYEYTPTGALDIKIGETGPTEGEFTQPSFNPQNTWGRLTSLADAATDVLKALAEKLSPKP